MPISTRTIMNKSEEDMEEDLNLSLQIGGCRNKRKRDDHGDDEMQIGKEKSFEEPLLMQLSLPSVLSGRKNKQNESQDQFTPSTIQENNKSKPALFTACHQHSSTSSEQEKQPEGNNGTEDDHQANNIAESQYVATVISDTAAVNDDENGHAKKKLRLSKEQAFLLEENFRKHATLNPKLKVTLAKELTLQPRQVEVWFQNRRARTKLKQTEIDCKFLKHRYHMLTLENCRLKREVAELRAFRTAYPTASHHPLYKHMPVAGNGLPFCHSCLHGTAFLSDQTNTGTSTRKANTFAASLMLKPQF